MVNQAYWSWINGDFTIQPSLPISGGLIQHGYGVFETCYVEGDCIRYWDAHMERLTAACAQYSLDFKTCSQSLKRIAEELIIRNALREARLKISVGAKNLDYYSEGLLTSNVVLTTAPYQRKKHLVTLHPIDATKIGCPLSRYKTVNYMGYIHAKKVALTKGDTDALLLNETGDAIETSTANLFIKSHDQWLTPELSTYGLAGIQRDTTLKGMRELGYQIKETSLPYLSHKQWQEGFVCNSLIGLQQIQSIGTHRLQVTSKDFIKIKEYIRSMETLEV